MLSLKENFFETYRNGKPDAFVTQWEVFPQVWDPIFYYMYPIVPQSGQTVINPLGVSIYWGPGEPGAMPIVNEKTKVIKDVTKWRDYVEFFDFRDKGLDWTQAKADADKIRAEGKFVMCWNVTGLFEMTHFLMGFEDTFINLLEEPEAMHDLIDAIKDFKISQQQYIIDELNPDVLLTHDDWGSKRSLFMSPDLWREFYKEPWREIDQSISKKNGKVHMFHADSFLEPIVKDMLEIGIDFWQGVLPTNNIQKIKKDTDHKMLLMGGIDVAIADVPNWTEEIVRAEVARACKEYHEGGMYIPALTMGGEGSLFPGVNEVVMDEIRNQSKIYFK